MNCIFSIKKQYCDLIFNKIKPIEFRNKLPKLEKNDKVFIYETKNKGCGMVVGYFTVKDMKPITYNKIGTYIYMDLYAKMFCDEKTQKIINKAKQINLTNYDNSLVLSYLFMEEWLDEMLETNEPPKKSNNLFVLNKKEIQDYYKSQNKQRDFCEACDKWLNNIGFYNEDDSSNWKYEITIDKIKKFEKPINIQMFQLQNGNYLKKAPQSFCYTLNN